MTQDTEVFEDAHTAFRQMRHDLFVLPYDFPAVEPDDCLGTYRPPNSQMATYDAHGDKIFPCVICKTDAPLRDALARAGDGNVWYKRSSFAKSIFVPRTKHVCAKCARRTTKCKPIW